MKNAIGIFVVVLTLASCSQSVDVKEKQQVRVENINGVQTVTVITVKNSVEKKEVFKGKAGDAKLKELNDESGKMNPTMKEEVFVEKDSRKVKMINENGNKTLTVEETKNGKTTKETFKGDDADKKMKEIEAQKSM